MLYEFLERKYFPLLPCIKYRKTAFQKKLEKINHDKKHNMFEKSHRTEINVLGRRVLVLTELMKSQ